MYKIGVVGEDPVEESGGNQVNEDKNVSDD